jgi:hypothetical protein
MDFHFLRALAQKSAGETPHPKMPEDIQERIRALITQHGSALAALTALQQHLEAQRNDEQIDYLENHVPNIDVPIEFNQGTSKSAHERHNHLQRERRAKQREQHSFRNDALQLFGDKDALAPGQWDCGEWTQYVDFVAQKCGSKNDRQSRQTTTHNFICVARTTKFYC